MDWYVEITEEAERDIEGIYQYIAVSLGEPGIAWKQIERIREKINKLSFMPERNQVIQEEPWKSHEVRRTNVGNYSAFYVCGAKTSTVTVIRVFYAKRDLSNIYYEE